MLVQVRLFAMLRERAGADSVALELEDGATVQDAIEAVRRQHGLDELIERMPVVMAVNREYAPEESVLSEGDELALIPPVSGGSARTGAAEVHVRVTDEPLSLERLAGIVGRAAAGAIVTFQGTTRDVERLEYEAYREMAEEKMTAILGDAIERHGLDTAAAEHRIGSVARGLSSVIVAVSAAHREEAFAGAREIIDRIKAEAPIWKKEVEEGSERWVEGESARGEEDRV
jgi:molybdopterin synthase catalytic subunit